MDLAAIKALPVSQLAASDCALICWATAPMLPEAIDNVRVGISSVGQAIIDRREARLRHRLLLPQRGGVLAPRHEVATESAQLRNLILAPVREHSRKPDQMRTDIEALWDGPYIELFSRASAPGWHCWGREAGKY
jgi:N6-adenosine-specific RNA methylase IME4